MKTIFLVLAIAVSTSFISVEGADGDAPKPAEPTLEQRVADIEAYFNNAARASTQGSKIGGAGPGHNAWMMTSAALVLFMTLPGLALFYGGLVRRKNVLSVLAQCLGITGLVTLIWWAVGYSLCFSKGGPILGGLDFAFMKNVGVDPNTDYAGWVSHNIWFIYQMMFAIITPALIIGAIAERMKFSAVMLFVALWMFIVYFPAAHMLWGIDGMMNGVWNAGAKVKGIDFAGGIVVHMTSGWSALVLCMVLGPRKNYGREIMAPHSMVLCLVGTGMLWVGWYGFNAGSAAAADGIAANAFVTTTLAAAVGSFAWAMAEYITRGKPSVLGFCSGAIGGLATITPASGFVLPSHAIIIGLVAGVGTFLACTKLKVALGYDDALDTFGVHAVGGTLGVLFAGIFATGDANPNLNAEHIKGLVDSNKLWMEQVKAGGLVLLLSVVGTAVIGFIIKLLLGGMRVTVETETAGLDLTEHGEEGYNA
jgi:Amt family ammonium transporter